MRPILLGLIAATLVGAGAVAPPAMAQAPADRADARCIMVLAAAARDPKNRESALRGSFYYLGRLETRGPASRLEPLMLSEGRAITSAEMAGKELNRCVSELNARGGAFQAMLQRVSQQARPAGKGPPPTK